MHNYRCVKFHALLFFIFISLFFVFISIFMPYNIYVTIFMFVIYMCVLFFVAKKHTLAFVFLIFINFTQLSSIVSNFFIEQGMYLSELGTNSYALGSTQKLISFVIVMNVVFVIFFELLFKLNSSDLVMRDRSKSDQKIYLIICVICLACIVFGLINGFPLLNLEQRFLYWISHQFGGVASKVIYILSYLSLYYGYVYNNSSTYFFGNRKLHITLISAVTFFIAILYAYKFSWFENFILCWFIGSRCRMVVHGEKLNFSFKRLLPKIFLIFVPVLFIVVISYIFVHGYSDSHSLGNILYERIFAMQGQVWWAVNSTLIDDPSKLPRDLSQFFLKSTDGSPYGIFLIMKEIMPIGAFNDRFELLIPLTVAFPAFAIFHFGYLWGVFIVVLLMFYYSVMCVVIFKSLVSGRVLNLFFAIIIFSISMWTFLLGSAYVIFSFSNILCWLFLFFINSFYFIYYKKRILMC